MAILTGGRGTRARIAATGRAGTTPTAPAASYAPRALAARHRACREDLRGHRRRFPLPGPPWPERATAGRLWLGGVPGSTRGSTSAISLVHSRAGGAGASAVATAAVNAAVSAVPPPPGGEIPNQS